MSSLLLACLIEKDNESYIHLIHLISDQNKMYVEYYELINKFVVSQSRRSVFLNLSVCLCHKRLLDKIHSSVNSLMISSINQKNKKAVYKKMNI